MSYPLLLHGRHAPAAIAYQELGPWMVPNDFGALDAEYRALRESSALIDYSIYARIDVTGADRVDFLHRILSNDIRALSPGEGTRAAVLSPNGKILAELLVLSETDQLTLLCEASRADTVVATLDRYLFTEQVALSNRERSDALLALQGPKTFAIIKTLFGEDLSGVPALHHRDSRLDGIAVRLIRHALSASQGALLAVPADAALAVWDYLRTRGRQAGLWIAGWQALNTARIEAGIAWYGVDADESNLLPETGLDDALISESKGCYVGQEIVARMRTYGSASKKLMGLEIQSDQVPDSGCRILCENEEAGWVTSACLSPAVQHARALGYVKRPYYEAKSAVEPARRVTILHAGQTLAATVTALPFTLPAR